MKRLPACALLALLALSCRTVPARLAEAPKTREATVESITRLIDSDRPFEALQDISTLSRSSTSAAPAEIGSLSEQAESKVKDQFSAAVKGSDYERAYELFSSFRLLHPGAFPGWTKAQLLLDVANEYRAKSMLIPSLLVFGEALRAGAQARSVVTTYGDLAVSEMDRIVLRQIVDYMTAEKLPIPPSYTELLNRKLTPADMLSGVVTVWVNRGIKLENGVGFPDTVIGSGFFVDKEGYLITNYHVIQSVVDPSYSGYTKLSIRLSTDQNTVIPAKVVGYDRVFDIALLKVSVTPRYIFSFNDIEDFQPGQRIYAIGSPGGLENTITAGIISASGRQIQQVGDTLQIDVPVNPGNSGGPLVDDASQLVGVVFAGIEQFQGINFAIPGHWVTMLVPALYRGGEVRHPWLGMEVTEAQGGLEVTYVLPDSPAARAGLREGDVIESIDGERFTKVRDAQEAILRLSTDSLVKLQWERGTESVVGIIAAGARPFVPLNEALRRDTRDNVIVALFGMDLALAKTTFWGSEYRVTNVYPGSIADETGLSAGDSIVINKWIVNRAKEAAMLEFNLLGAKAGFSRGGVEIDADLRVSDFI